jgi:hypothetical protein
MIIKSLGDGSEDALGRMFRPSPPRENADARAVSTDSMGNRDETLDGRYTHMFRKRVV